MTASSAVGTIKVVIAGVNGRMGRASLQALDGRTDLAVVGAFGRQGAPYVGKDIGEISAFAAKDKTGILVSNGFLDSVTGAKPDVLLDFTLSEIAVENAKAALERGIRPVIGTSGISPQETDELAKIASQKKLGAMIVPNFSVGAVLMMEFSRQAAAMFEHAEIIEMHHPAKVDAPSGTAMHTVRKIAASGNQFNKPQVQEKELLKGARGGSGDAGVHVHSLRLPGLISHQEVIFGGDGELLSIKHDSFTVDCFLKGIVMALKAVMQQERLTVGLESILSLGAK
ncbi:MAG TPA: 4-hydroxy-tetrahydrodipicolinate reductase [Planktothrix sp.]